ncbi:hypothetical protein EDC01DRAFT_779314 [Geopyxis carbonaria]|nr:hypothetical protein EDC01DRAFT_779314 [Geopyxis carbonaria]
MVAWDTPCFLFDEEFSKKGDLYVSSFSADEDDEESMPYELQAEAYSALASNIDSIVLPPPLETVPGAPWAAFVHFEGRGLSEVAAGKQAAGLRVPESVKNGTPVMAVASIPYPMREMPEPKPAAQAVINPHPPSPSPLLPPSPEQPAPAPAPRRSKRLAAPTIKPRVQLQLKAWAKRAQTSLSRKAKKVATKVGRNRRDRKAGKEGVQV